MSTKLADLHSTPHPSIGNHSMTRLYAPLMFREDPLNGSATLTSADMQESSTPQDESYPSPDEGII